MLTLSMLNSPNFPFGTRLPAALVASATLHWFAMAALDVLSTNQSGKSWRPPLRVSFLAPPITATQIPAAPNSHPRSTLRQLDGASHNLPDRGEGRKASSAQVSIQETAPLDLESARELARTIAREVKPRGHLGNTVAGSVLPEAATEPEPTPMEKAIRRATNEDCREKYASAGLLGLPLLLKDQLASGGCRW